VPEGTISNQRFAHLASSHTAARDALSATGVASTQYSARVTHDDNPAGRLYTVLRAMTKANPKANVTDVLPTVLGIKPNDRPELLRVLSHLLALPDQAKAAIEAVDDINHDIHLRWYRPACDYLTRATYLHLVTGDITSGLDEAALFSLEICSDTLHRRFPDSSVTERQLKQISDLINDLKAAIEHARNDDGLDPELDRFMSELVGALARGLSDFAIRGTDALADAFDLVRGRASRTPDAVRTTQEDHPNVWAKLVNVMTKFALVLTVVNAGWQLESNAMLAIDSPGNHTIVVVDHGSSSENTAAQASSEHKVG
jgi:hypothetical protein